MYRLERKIRTEVEKTVGDALRTLLCDKHLYQCVSVKPEPLMAMTKLTEDQRILEAFQSEGPQGPFDPVGWVNTGLNIPWIIASCDIKREFADIALFPLLSINTYCSICDSQQPFNPIKDRCASYLRIDHDEAFNQDQTYHLVYECQHCQQGPKTYVRFLVRRDKLKFRLCGRDPIEAIPAPKELPKPHNEFFASATMAYNTGQVLAGIFFLRAFIEQFWRSIPAVQIVVQAMLTEKVRASGDEQGNAYQATLPVAFRDSIPSLSEVYGKLSAAMHEANPDAALFKDCHDKILRHFKGREAFQLDAL